MFISEHFGHMILVLPPHALSEEGILTRDAIHCLETVENIFNHCEAIPQNFFRRGIDIIIPSGASSVFRDETRVLTVGQAMQDWLLEKKIPKSCLHLDENSSDLLSGVKWMYRMISELFQEKRTAVYIVAQVHRAKRWKELLDIVSLDQIPSAIQGCRYGTWQLMILDQLAMLPFHLELPALKATLQAQIGSVPVSLNSAGTR